MTFTFGKLALAATLGLAAIGAQAETWPARPVRIIVPYNAGTPPDISSRIIAQKLTLKLGQTFYVDNKPGASGSLAAGDLDRYPADGYTAMTLLTPVVVGPALLSSFKKDFARDYAPVGQYDWTYSVLVVTPSLPVHDVKGLIELLRAKPDTYSFPSGGYGTPAHLAGELFKQRYGVTATHVPYNQFTAGLADLVAGRVNFMFLTSTVAAAQVQGGKVKALAIASRDSRLPGLPDVPTMEEQGFKGFDVRNWDGFVMRKETPKAAVAGFTQALNQILADPETRKALADAGADPVSNTTAEQFGALIASEQARLTDLVRQTSIKID
ncbi:tripartite tricarboxylate transporter substrate binding protein [Pigmentiphaga sp.]|uniref:Bug family tripartite tricarboxylate transporter substrate binding protein n=1 Tax=Pigmentiphaga sp. TaxID=1977564 RepID=UPI0025CF9CAA|nr:tripartite tricarboxylate transporter substrate binding protein [Pigmentiphaga sp.]